VNDDWSIRAVRRAPAAPEFATRAARFPLPETHAARKSNSPGSSEVAPLSTFIKSSLYHARILEHDRYNWSNWFDLLRFCCAKRGGRGTVKIGNKLGLTQATIIKVSQLYIRWQP